MDETSGRFSESTSTVRKSDLSCDCGGSCGCAHSTELPKQSDTAVLSVAESLPDLFAESGRDFGEKPKCAENRGCAFDRNGTFLVSGTHSEGTPSENFASASDSVFTAKTFSVSTPNYHRATMTTLDIIPGTSTAVQEFIQRFSKPGPRLVTCPTCDEPFVPTYLSVCEECGYTFGGSSDDGQTTEQDDAQEDVSTSGMLLMAGVLVVLTIMLALLLVFFVR
jgi:hypothetical protein